MTSHECRHMKRWPF